MVYKRYIYRDGKRFGPYYYKTYRDKDGKTHSKYIDDKSAVIHKSVFRKHSTLFILLGVMFLLVLGFAFLSNQVSQSEKISSQENGGFSFGNLIKSFYSFTGLATEDSVSSDTSSETDTSSATEEQSTSTETVPETDTSFSTTENAEEQIVTETISESSNDSSSSNEEPINETSEETTNETIESVNETTIETNESVQNETIIEQNETLGNAGVILNETDITVIENMTNVTILNETSNYTLQTSTKQYGAVLGKPVKWEKRVKVDVEGQDSINGLVIDLPELAGNVSVKKINEYGEEEIVVNVKNEKNVEEIEPTISGGVVEDSGGLGFFGRAFNFILSFFRGMNARVVDSGENNVEVEVTDKLSNNDELVLEYYTEAPYSEEKNTNNGKEITVVGSEIVHYKDILAFTNLTIEVKRTNNIKLYWLVNDSKQEIEFQAFDEDDNGLFDRIEWVVPSLSNQSYELIIITKAEHLDENKLFISDIYEQVKTLDGNWSETIPSGNYVRVIFEKNLTFSNDITLYPRVINGTPKIEVYEVNNSDLIAEFSNLTSYEYNRVLLTNLIAEQDTFDLKVVDGYVEFDYIVDPVAQPGGATELRAQVCSSESNTEGKGSFADVCAGTYPSTCYGVGGTDLISCRDYSADPLGGFETVTSGSTIDYGGIRVQTYNSSITDCDSINQVYLCYSRWASATTITECDISVDANDGASYTAVTTVCPGRTANPVTTCVNITANETWVCSNFFGASGTRALSKSEFKSTATATKTVYWDALFFNVTYTQTASNTASKWQTNSTNSTLAGAQILHSINWTDDTALAGYIFSFDNGTGTFTNDSWVAMNGILNWSNVTKGVNTTVGSTIQWKVYANDSSNAWNVTSAFSYVTTNTAPMQGTPTFSPTSPTVLQNFTCSNQSTFDANGNSVTNIYNWLINGTSLMLLNLPFDTNVSSTGSQVKDYSGRGANGTIFGTVPWQSNGKVGGAYNFLSVSNYINITSSTLSLGSNFTINFWFNNTGGGMGSYIAGLFTIGNASISGISLGLYSFGPPYFQTIINQTIINDPGSFWPTANVWYMYTVSCKPNNCSMYINGDYINSTSSTPTTSGYNLEIGRGYYYNPDLFTYTLLSAESVIDEFKVYNRTLSALQIYQLYMDTKNSLSSNSTIVSGETSAGQNWTCQITPNDAIDDGALSQNYTLIQPNSNPPNVTLVSPSNTSTVYDLTNFICNVTDDVNLANISLYGNWSGGWHLNQTVNINGTSNSTTFNVTGLTNATYLWNCLAYDNDSQPDWGNSNFTVTNDVCGLTQISSSTTLTANNCEHYNITANNVAFNCNGYTISGNNSDTYFGININGLSGVNITNCNMQKYAKGILINNSNNSRITNTTLYNNSHLNATGVNTYGIYMGNAINTTINSTNITKLWSNSTSISTCYSGVLYGIYMSNSNNTVINNSRMNNISGQYYGDTSATPGCQAGYVSIGDGIYNPSAGPVYNLDMLNSNFSYAYNYNVYLLSAYNVLLNNSNLDHGIMSFVVGGGNVSLWNNNLNYSSSTLFYAQPMNSRLTIRNNQFHHSLNGISLANTVTNGTDIIGNTFSNISSYFIKLASPNVTLNDNILRNPPFGSDVAGISVGTGSTGCSANNNTLINFTGGAAIYFVADSANFSYINITDCVKGFYILTADNVQIWNSTVSNCTTDIYSSTTANNLELYNVSFNKSRVRFATNGSGFVEVFYQYRTNVTNQNYDALSSASVDIKDALGATIGSTRTTDGTGLTPAEWIMEYNQTGNASYSSGCNGSTSYINCSTPHNVTASKTNYSTNSTNVTINNNMISQLTLYSPYILSYVPVTDNFSITEPSNQIFSITYTNYSATTIRWFVNGTEQTSYINNSQFIWVGNYSQAGFYAIKVNITDSNGAFDDQTWYMTVLDAPPRVEISLIYPTGNLNVTQNTFFNVTLNVTCRDANCGTINVSLYSNYSLLNSTQGATPFYTNASTNPLTTNSLNVNDSQTINFWVNATGAVNSTYDFFAYANLTSNLSINNKTSNWNVTIANAPFAVSIYLSPKLSSYINWTLDSLPAYNQSAGGNNGTLITEYYINISVEGGTADIYMKANDDLKTSGGDILGIGNETYSYNYTNSSVPSDNKISLTTNYSNNKIGDAMGDLSVIYLKFFLNAPNSQPAGTYNNSLLFKAVQTGQTP